MQTNIKLPPIGISGNYRIEKFTVSKKDADFFNLRQSINRRGREIKAGTYRKLVKNNTIIMSNTPAEIDDHYGIITYGKGNILINGLGLGVVVSSLLQKKEVISITVIEISKDVIKLVASIYDKDPRVKIINADAFSWIPPKVKYDYVWHDIWDNICSDNISEMITLHHKFGKRCFWQRSWCKELCSLLRKSLEV